MTESNTNNTPKLPIQRILVLSFQLIKQRLNTFIRLGLPLLLIAIVTVWINFDDETILNIMIQTNIHPFFMFLIFMLLWAILVMVTVGCHRGFLMDETGIQKTKTLRWQAREWRFLGWGFLIGLIIGLFLVIWGFVLGALSLDQSNTSTTAIITNQVLSLPILYFFSRWSLIFPSIAVDDPQSSLTEAWWLSEGNGWRMTFMIAIVPFIMDILFSFIPTHDSYVVIIFRVIIWLFIILYQIGLLSLSYSFLKEGSNDKGDNAGKKEDKNDYVM